MADAFIPAPAINICISVLLYIEVLTCIVEAWKTVVIDYQSFPMLPLVRWYVKRQLFYAGTPICKKEFRCASNIELCRLML